MTSKEFIESKQKASIKEKFKEGKMDEVTPEEVKPFNETIAKEIDRQRKRIGGNFLVVYATATQVDRNLIRKILPDCTFITLTLTKEAQKKMILARHDEKTEADTIKFLTDLYDRFELPGENESNTYNLDTSEEMTRDDVFRGIDQILKDI